MPAWRRFAALSLAHRARPDPAAPDRVATSHDLTSNSNKAWINDP